MSQSDEQYEAEEGAPLILSPEETEELRQDFEIARKELEQGIFYTTEEVMRSVDKVLASKPGKEKETD